MAGGKLSPRQKMINMMYLVLTALLALNVSKEILKSFHLMEVSFNKASENLDSKIAKQMTSFGDQAQNDPKLKPYFARATEAKNIADGFVNYIDGIKSDLIEKTGGRQDADEEDEGGPSYEQELTGMDNIEVHANYFMVNNADGAKEKGWKGKELEAKVKETRTKLIGVLKQDTTKGVTIDPKKMKAVDDACQLVAQLTEKELEKYPSWSAKYLEHSPLAGVITMLTKMQSDVRATQGAVLDVLNQGKITVVKVDGFIPVIKPVSGGGVVMSGDEYKAEIFLAAITSGSENDEYILQKGGTALVEEDGKHYYVAKGGSPGNFEYSGVVKVKTAEGDITYPFKGEYQVFQGGATISATKMNVLYIGVDNPISVGVPGVSPAGVRASMQGGTISRSGKDWVARVTNKGRATIVASATMSDGSMRRMGQMEYRVKQLPKPEAKWGTVESGTSMARAAVAIHRTVRASMGVEFAFEGLKYRVTGYRFVLAPRKGEAFMASRKGASIPGGFSDKIRKAKRGDRILIDKIRAVGPDGKQRNLKPILIELT
ncbi:MAG: gliding motility-associated protein GldM [Bacteroidia bacterium]|jgi:gliding motility-associated protein GldM